MENVIQPFDSGYLSVDDRNVIYWEASGNPKGQPAIYLHGGPGGGIGEKYRNHFDPEFFLIVSFEQRGCGRSKPNVNEPQFDLTSNTTQNLIADIEQLRSHLGIERWLILGISWGTTLALAYAQAHPQRVSGFVLAAVHIPTPTEVEWITEGIRCIFPEKWNEFSKAVPREKNERLIDAYYRQIKSSDRKIRESTALSWCAWEDAHVSLNQEQKPSSWTNNLERALTFATLVIHYWKNSAFLGESEVFQKIGLISHLPCTLIHGRLDVSSPTEVPWQIHQAWPDSELIVIESEGHGGKLMFNEITKAINLSVTAAR